MVRTEPIVLTLTGASGSQQSARPINGLVLAIAVTYTDIAAATTDVTIATLGSSSPAVTILTLTDSATASGWVYPRVTADTPAGVEITGTTEFIPVDDYIVVSAAQSDAGVITVYVKYVE